MSQVSQICLRNQNRAFSLRLVNVLSAKGFFQCLADMTRQLPNLLQPYKNRSSMPNASISVLLLMRWQIVDNLLRREGNPRSGSSSSGGGCQTHRPKFVHTGLPVTHSIPKGSCSGACSSSTRTRQTTCLSVSTPLATISQWWNSAPYRRPGRNLSSQTSI